MTPQEFQEFVKEHTWRDKDIFFTANNLTGELGEVCNVIKKKVAYEDFPNYKRIVDQEVLQGIRDSYDSQFVDEAGDTLFYFLQLLNKQGVTLDEVIQKQVEKINNQSEQGGKPYLK